jgi:hypothetical protein
VNKTLKDQLGVILDDLYDALEEAQTAVDEQNTPESREVYGLVDDAMHAVEDALREG